MGRLPRRLASLFRTLFRQPQLDRALDEELRSYLDHQIASRVARGESPADARRHVLAEEGGVEPIKEHTRDARLGFGVATLLHDIRYGVRAMRRSPGYTSVACLTLALGIGASITMFTVMQSVLWRPLPYASPDRLIVIEASLRGAPDAGVSGREAHDMLARTRVFSALAIVNGVDAHVEIDGDVERVAAASVSEGFLPALGVMPALGRPFDARDNSLGEAGQVRSVIVSDALWRRRLGASPAAIGRWIVVNNMPRQVVGVMPAHARMFLPASTAVQESTHVWFPTTIDATDDYRGNGAIARLADGMDAGTAQRELDRLASALAAEHPSLYKNGPVRLQAADMREALTAGVNGGLRALGLAVAFVLLVSCVNVANLTLARSAGRARELAIRRALGAGRTRVLRQLLTESLLLSSASGLIGVGLAYYGTRLLDWLRPTHLPRQSDVGMDAMVALFAIAVSIAAGALFGVLPAWRSSGDDAVALRAGRADSPARSTRRMQRALVVAEIALSIVPLVAAGLMLRSFANLQKTNLGFQADRVITAWMPVSFRKFPDLDAKWKLHQNVLDRVRAIPGVEAASAGSPPPFHSLQFTRFYGRYSDGPPSSTATLQSVLPGYLPITGTRLLAGRDFTDDDIRHRRPVVIVDSRIARELWPGGAVGQHLALSGRPVWNLEVIGVTEPVRVTDVRDDRVPHVFIPYHRFAIEMALVIKTDLPAAALAPAIRRAAAEAGTDRAVFDVWPMQTYVDRSIASTRFMMLVLSGFACAALLLAGIGLYGTLAYLTSQRAREFGVRLALGASRRQILMLVSREGLALTAAGIVAGLAAAMAVAQLLRSLLFGVGPLDPATLAGVTALVAVIAMAACMRPAWTAGTTDPTNALRAD